MVNYVIITPAKNEVEYIEKTIRSVVNQTVLPSEYIIVNDGSTDGTEKIIEKYQNEYPWIQRLDRPQGKHRPGDGVIEAFYEGYNAISVQDWQFLVKLDGDLQFEPDYFEQQIKRFSENEKLGITSGVTCHIKGNQLILDRMPEDHTRGAAKMYRKACWNDIGGLLQVLGWDTFDELKAQVMGWKTQSFRDLPLIHFKPIGFKQKSILRRELKAGERYHYMGYFWLFFLLKSIYRMLHKPFFIAGFLNLYGFFKAQIAGTPQIQDSVMINHLKRKQKKRLTHRHKLVG
jgi:glycosyltransferase involved in cell wall biosynthesis